MNTEPYLTGHDIVGKQVEICQEGKYGMFKTTATVIKYRDHTRKGWLKYLLEFKPYGKQQHPFKMWCRRSDFKQINHQ